MTGSPVPHTLRNPDALKALTHPRRRQILRRLSDHGPATSAILARALDLNTGATSYHLRELARHGLIAEATHRSRGRERWWQPAHADLRFPLRSEQDADTRAAFDEFQAHAAGQDWEDFRQSLQRESSGPWADAFPFSRGSVRVTLEQLAEFFEDYIALLNKYDCKIEDADEDARVVHTRLLAFPAPPPEAAPDTDASPDADPA